MSRHKGTQGSAMTNELSPERIKRNLKAKIKEEKYWESLASEVTIINNNNLRQEKTND